MFFKKKTGVNEKKLIDLVKKVANTEYVFVNINNDLGSFCEDIMKSTPLVMMAYGYARRSAAAAMYAQGLISKDLYEHAVVIFKSLQIKTDHTVEFQEKAFSQAVELSNSYHWQINSFLLKQILNLVQNYEVPEGGDPISDAELIEAVIDIAHSEQAEVSAQRTP